MKTISALASIFFLLTVACGAPAIPTQPELLVAAASSLGSALPEIAEQFTRQTGVPVTVTFGATSALAQQIENGAPYDVFLAADSQTITRLADQDLVIANTVAVYGRGQLVLAVNLASGLKAPDLSALLSDSVSHVAIANPELAPYGRAARQALDSAGLWDALQPKIVLGANVRQALQYVQSGDAQAGLVSRAEADAPEVTWTAIDPALYDPIDQTLAVLANTAQEPTARAFAIYVLGPQGRAVLQRYGFTFPETP